MKSLSEIAAAIVGARLPAAQTLPVVITDPPPFGAGKTVVEIKAMTPEEVERTAAAIREAGVPDECNRWAGRTPQEMEAEMAKAGPKENALKDMRTKKTSQINDSGLHMPVHKSEHGDDAADRPAGNPGGKTMATKATKAPKAKTGKKAAAKAAPAKKAAKATKAVAAKKVAGAPKELRANSKNAMIAEMLRRPDGCTTAEVLQATNWPAVSMPQQAKLAGITLKKQKDGKVTRYFAA